MRYQFVNFCVVVVSLIAPGCSNNTVREDRSVNFSGDGDSVGFQHGDDGVFVAGSDGQTLHRIFESDESTIAVSSPRWSPIDKRLIFSVARSAKPDDAQATRPNIDWNAAPEGRRFGPESIVYTCMLRSDKSDPLQSDQGDEQDEEPVPVFEATCNHAGYVAADLAVRWHPSGNRIVYVDQVQPGVHSLFEFEIETGSKKRLIDKAAHALVFDWTPQGKYLVCTLANEEGSAALDNGIWIRESNGRAWWQIPNSGNLPTTDSFALVERLRASRGCWTSDEKTFAFVQTLPPQSTKQPEPKQAAVMVADLESRQSRELCKAQHPVSDMHWNPIRRELGFLESGTNFTVVDLKSSKRTSALEDLRLRRFAGWNHDGSNIAVCSPVTVENRSNWALMFHRIADVRDDVFVLDPLRIDTSKPPVLSDMRVTFPQWSPTNQELSLWCTYSPSYRSWFSSFLPWTLMPGDPAAIVDTETGEIRWMPVNPMEEAQVGHYFLLKGNYEEAWQWYEKSIEQRKSAEKIKLSQLAQFMRRSQIHQDSTFFEYICLAQLGRTEEANQRLGEFRSSMRFDLEDASSVLLQWQGVGEEAEPEGFAETVSELDQFIAPLLQSAYAAEVFLSLGAVEEGIEYFESEMDSGERTDIEKLAAALSHSQLLLIAGEVERYVQQSVEVVFPRFFNLHGPGGSFVNSVEGDLGSFASLVKQNALVLSVGLDLLPMMSREFASLQPALLREETLNQLQADRSEQTDALRLLVLDLAIRAFLTDDSNTELSDVQMRIDKNESKPSVSAILTVDDIDSFITDYREAF